MGPHERAEKSRGSLVNAPQNPANSLVVVIRVAFRPGIDPFAEIDNVIQRVGHCWFGKIGKPISPMRMIATEDSASFAVLTMPTPGPTGGLSKAAVRTSRTYEILDASSSRPADGAYPAYYESSLRQMRTWLKLQPSCCLLSLDELRVLTSGRSALDTLVRCSSAHLFCSAESRA